MAGIVRVPQVRVARENVVGSMDESGDIDGSASGNYQEICQGLWAGVEKGSGQLLDELCATTGWSRDNARQAIRTAKSRKGAARNRCQRPWESAHGRPLGN